MTSENLLLENIYSPVPKPGDIFYSDLIRSYILVLKKPKKMTVREGAVLSAECLILTCEYFTEETKKTEKTFSPKCGWKFVCEM